MGFEIENKQYITITSKDILVLIEKELANKGYKPVDEIKLNINIVNEPWDGPGQPPQKIVINDTIIEITKNS